MNIVLIGYRGTGKSEVALELAARTGYHVISTDDRIEKQIGMRIADYVEANSWEAFRDVESEVVRETTKTTDTIVDTGGGAILREANAKALKACGRVVWLTASAETIRARIASDTNRPSLTGTGSFVDEVDQILAERVPLYKAAADITVSTEGRTTAEVAEIIIAEFASESP